MPTTTLAKIRNVAIGGAAAALALPLTLVSTPAQAATLAGCTVTPLNPVRIGSTATGTPLLRFSTRVSCVKDRIVQIRDQRFEADPPPGVAGDDFLGQSVYLQSFPSTGGVVLSSVDVVTNTEAGAEEVYHRVSFRVVSINGVSAWTPFQNSGLVSVAI